MVAVGASALQRPPLFVARRLFANPQFSYPRLGATGRRQGPLNPQVILVKAVNLRFSCFLR